MAIKYREKWTREETILAFDLYCKTPFSKIAKTNKDIIELANLIGRTPSSVGLKMANLAHFDPTLIARDVKGMANGSKLDKEIFDEFSNDWEELSYQAQIILAKYNKVSIESLNPQLGIEMIPAGEYREIETKARIGQYFFRTSVLMAYGNQCCITGIRKPELLIASHIKPWSVSDSKAERTNPRNGLSLNALHDKAFDKGLITLDSEYRLIMSSKIKDVEMDENTKSWFYSYEHEKIILPDKFIPDKKFIEYHNDVIYQG
ncbi:HNH endonuclease [Anaerosacchariphilus polymeriproducens]|uniref:HNH endonuclease n=1 Tax=Anaerosacchariphilus polymeriproducens TaxID=1812858 RepID=A0A371AUJ9_9FIRM|nr:HNH endonuclease [Anaerosacchariphilus polymeriproducens]RDU23231.1 HNH endonuclease [Anaerosacchariphilus polymeriproducens]